MGWLYVNRRKGTKIADFFKQEFDFETYERKGEVLECKVVHRREAYIAYRILDKVEMTEKVIAIVCLLDYRNHDYHNFGYKDMTENMGPNACNCPASVLNRLTFTDNECANSWRLRCDERAKEKERARIRKKAVKEFYRTGNYDCLRV